MRSLILALALTVAAISAASAENDVCAEPHVYTATCMAMQDQAERDACLDTVRAQRQCKPEKNLATGSTGGAVAVGSSQQAACAQLLRNARGEYSAGKCVCQKTPSKLWRCTLGN